jgi:hypothetical protein
MIITITVINTRIRLLKIRMAVRFFQIFGEKRFCQKSEKRIFITSMYMLLISNRALPYSLLLCLAVIWWYFLNAFEKALKLV